jgi:hypothetical protein
MFMSIRDNNYVAPDLQEILIDIESQEILLAKEIGS